MTMLTETIPHEKVINPMLMFGNQAFLKIREAEMTRAGSTTNYDHSERDFVFERVPTMSRALLKVQTQTGAK